MKEPTELNKLAERLKKNDPQAGGEIFDHFSTPMYRYFLVRTSQKETAQDLMSESFSRMLEHIDQFNIEQGNFNSWFWRIARNLLIDTYRQKKPVQSLDSMQDAGIDIVDPTERILPHVELQRVLKIIKTLPDDEQELFNLYFVADISYADLSEMMDKSEANLRVLVHRLKKKIIELSN